LTDERSPLHEAFESLPRRTARDRLISLRTNLPRRLAIATALAAACSGYDAPHRTRIEIVPTPGAAWTANAEQRARDIVDRTATAHHLGKIEGDPSGSYMSEGEGRTVHVSVTAENELVIVSIGQLTSFGGPTREYKGFRADLVVALKAEFGDGVRVDERD